MHYALYRLISRMLSPLLPWYLNQRVRAGKENPQRLAERFGKASLPRPQQPLLWFHAASMGESQSVLPLITRLSSDYPALQLLLTTVTVTSAEFVASRLPTGVIHQFAPIDTPQAIQRFLSYWQPDMACFVDSELWPNTLMELRRKSIPLILLNGRISDQSYRTWKRARSFSRQLLSSFTAIYAKSEEDARRFVELGARHSLCLGNLKFASPALAADPHTLAQLSASLEGRLYWLAASTHEGEEVLIGQIHHALKLQFPNLLTLLVPRHSRRGQTIAAQLESQGLQVALRSRQDAIAPQSDLYLADTMGELGIFYRLSPIVFIGGSLVPHGGQNPLEAARLHCAILYGAYMHNFREFCEALEPAGASWPVADASTLQEAVATLLSDPKRQQSLADAALQVVEGHQHVLERLVAELAQPIDRLLADYDH